MISDILSLNIGTPKEMQWKDKRVVSSMEKLPVDSPLIVSKIAIEGDSFANSQHHGTPDSVIYAFGMNSIKEYLNILGFKNYEPGALGENLTLSELDENNVSIGDTFRVGTVIAQATFPRIPCTKVNIRMMHEKGQSAMIETGRSGVYFRVLESGKISFEDKFERIEESAVCFPISEAYKTHLSKDGWQPSQMRKAIENGAFPVKLHDKFKQQLAT